ncbi:MAG: hypothetical protein ACPGF7_03725 [Pontibacterium sp.]
MNANVLNITNGDCAVDIMQQAKISGDFLPWRDVLHEGPVPDGLSLGMLSEVRAQFITSRGWGQPETIRQSFKERDKVLESSGNYARVVLWFEHDLYDQLQLLQILDWFSHNVSSGTALSIICTDQYLGLLSPDELKALVQYEVPVTQDQLTLAADAWAAFRSTNPQHWLDLLSRDLSALPYLEGAVHRLAEEYPDAVTGLSRTAHKALQIIEAGEGRPGRVFAAYQETEERKFLGDASFWVILNELLEARPLLVTLSEGEAVRLPAQPGQLLSLTAEARSVLSGEKSARQSLVIDRWLGGVHLTADNDWCWHAVSLTLSRL